MSFLHFLDSLFICRIQHCQTSQFAQQLREDLLARFAIFLNPSSPGFDPLPAAACMLDPTVSTILTDREDTFDLLAAAKALIRVQVLNRLGKKLANRAFLKVNNKFYD